MNSKLAVGLGSTFLILVSFGSSIRGQSEPATGAAPEVSSAVPKAQDRLQPNQVVDQPEHNFGEVQLGTSARHTFVLKNPTKTLMKIGEIGQSCGCTVPEISSKEIKPGESVAVVVAIQPGNYRGRKESTIQIRFDEPAEFEIQLKAIVTIRNLLVEPEPVMFRNVKIGVPTKQIIKVTRHGSPFWKITNVTTGSERLKASIAGRTIAGNVVTFEIECETTETETGQRNDRMIVHSNDTGEPEYAIPVHIETVGEVSVSVESIEFEQDGAGASKKFLIKTATPSEIVLLEVKPAGVLAKAAPGKKTFHLVEVVRESNADFKGELQLKLDISESTITIPVIAEKVK